MKKKEIVENLALDIGVGIHTALRKYTDHPQSMVAWKAIALMANDGAWKDLCLLVAEDIYKPMRKAFNEQTK